MLLHTCDEGVVLRDEGVVFRSDVIVVVANCNQLIQLFSLVGVADMAQVTDNQHYDEWGDRDHGGWFDDWYGRGPARRYL